MKRSLSFERHETALVVAGTALVAGTYGLVRLAYGLFLSDIQASTGLTATQAGYVSSGASVVYCAGALVGLVVGHRPRLLVLGALATACLGSVAMALAPGTAILVPAAVVSSAGAGLASPGLVGVVVRGVAGPRRDRAQAVVNSGTGPGLVVAGLLALVLPDWRWGFAVGALLTAAAGAAVLALDRPRPGAGVLAPTPWSWGALLALRVPAFGALLLGAGSAAVWTYGRDHLVDAGLGTTASVLAWVAVGVGGTATVATAGRQAAIGPTRAWSLTTPVAAVSVAGVGLGAQHPVLAPAACLLFGWGFVAASSALVAWASRLSPGRAASGAAALFVALVLGQAAGSSVLGTIAEHSGMTTAFLVAAATTLAAAACGRQAGAPTDQAAITSSSVEARPGGEATGSPPESRGAAPETTSPPCPTRRAPRAATCG